MKSLAKKYSIILIITIIVNIIILFIRNSIEENTIYNFLLWNLFLGILPFITVSVLVTFEQKLTKWMVWMGIGLWLLFYPNAPYMITDLIHICETPEGTPRIYDTVIIFSFAITSIFTGFYSLGLIYALISKIKNVTWGHFIIYISILLSSFGIYLGRILRLNSWDIFTKPLETFKLIIEHLFPITQNPTTYAMIILFSFLQFMLLYLIVDFQKVKNL